MKRVKIFQSFIDKNSCFECGGDVEEMHHVVPTVLGGTRVIPLCEVCHGKVHDLNRKGHSFLIKEGLKKTKNSNKLTGKPPMGFTIDDDNNLIPDEKEREIIRLVKSLRDESYSFREIKEYFDSLGIVSRANKPYHVASIHQLNKVKI